jgi:hypothetical protein
VNDEVERWINLEGPEPPGIKKLLDGARAALRPPEQVERMRRSFHAALAEQRRRQDREKERLRQRRRWQRVAWFAAAAVILAAVLTGGKVVTVIARRQNAGPVVDAPIVKPAAPPVPIQPPIPLSDVRAAGTSTATAGPTRAPVGAPDGGRGPGP